MRYILDIPRELNERIRNFLEQSDYKSIEEFVIVACENQFKIEEYAISEIENKLGIPKDTLTHRIADIQSLGLLSADLDNVKTIEPPTKLELPPAPLWGQINRILPIKIGIRILANMLKDDDQYLDLEEFREAAASRAREIGKILVKDDNLKKRKQGVRYSSGLPIGEKSIEKSKDRYKNQFLGYVDGKSIIQGALGKLKLANIVDGKIGITDLGLEFANLENPVLDSKNPISTLSPEEIEFYFNLLDKEFKDEAALMFSILDSISSGTNTREKINKNTKNFLEHFWPNIQDPAVNTMRAGVMSRMWELGLIDRERHGKEVTYKLTPEGEIYLKNNLGKTREIK